VPIAAPSANRFTGLSPTTAEHVRRGLKGKADQILDGGPSPVGIESTVLSLATDPPTLFRPGMVSREEIEALVGPVVLPPAAAPTTAHASPGLHRKHYSPRTPLVLVAAGDALPAGRGVLVGPTGQRPMPAEPRAYAARLYSVLHELDGEGLDWIAVEKPPDTAEWAGVNDRLRRAAAR
jgi:L-threonylcarbamoyladenylate synthase